MSSTSPVPRARATAASPPTNHVSPDEDHPLTSSAAAASLQCYSCGGEFPPHEGLVCSGSQHFLCVKKCLFPYAKLPATLLKTRIHGVSSPARREVRVPCRSCMTLSASVEPLCSYSLDQFVEGLFQHAMYCDKVDKTSGNLLKNGGGPNGNYEVAGLTDTVRKYVEKTHDVGAVLQAAGGKPTGPCGDFVSARKAPVSSANSRMKTLSTRGDAAASARLAGFVLPPKLSEAEEELAPAPSSRWNKRLLLSRKLREKFAKTRLPTLGGSRESTQEVEDGLDPLDRFETHGGTWVHTVPAHVTLDSTNLPKDPKTLGVQIVSCAQRAQDSASEE